jgi:CheY-like chemotaxis protein
MEDEILKGKTLLVVDDETDLRDIVASELEFMGARVFQAENITSAQKIIAQEKIDLIVSDIGGTGIDLLDIVKQKNIDIPPMILITGFADITTEDAFNKGAEALLNKPFKLDDLIKMVVRHTLPYEQRFAENVSATKLLNKPKSEVVFGRGGFSMDMEMSGKKFEIGEAINFDFVHSGHHIKGSGICRWFKHIDHGSNKALIGMEFMNLEDDSYKNFEQINSGKKIIPYIPALKS